MKSHAISPTTNQLSNILAADKQAEIAELLKQLGVPEGTEFLQIKLPPHVLPGMNQHSHEGRRVIALGDDFGTRVLYKHQPGLFNF